MRHTTHVLCGQRFGAWQFPQENRRMNDEALLVRIRAILAVVKRKFGQLAQDVEGTAGLGMLVNLNQLNHALSLDCDL